MLVMTRESDARQAHYLLQDFLSFDAPRGYRAELLDGEIFVSPSAEGNHDHAKLMLEDFLSVETPQGYRAEFIDGEIIVAPPPDGHHGEIVGLIVEQVFTQSGVRMHFHPDKGLIVPDRGSSTIARVVPDAAFAPAELRLFHNAPSWMEAAGLAMVLEVTSSRSELDRIAKRHAYASADVPLYLLVDRKHRRVNLFSEPAVDDYQRTISVLFGTKLDLPKPFAFTLDTAPFAE